MDALDAFTTLGVRFVCSVDDVNGAWGLIREAVESRLPLRRVPCRGRHGGASTLPSLSLDIVPSSNPRLRSAYAHARSPVSWIRLPYARLIVIAGDDPDEARAALRAALRAKQDAPTPHHSTPAGGGRFVFGGGSGASNGSHAGVQLAGGLVNAAAEAELGNPAPARDPGATRPGRHHAAVAAPSVSPSPLPPSGSAHGAAGSPPAAALPDPIVIYVRPREADAGTRGRDTGVRVFDALRKEVGGRRRDRCIRVSLPRGAGRGARSAAEGGAQLQSQLGLGVGQVSRAVSGFSSPVGAPVTPDPASPAGLGALDRVGEPGGPGPAPPTQPPTPGAAASPIAGATLRGLPPRPHPHPPSSNDGWRGLDELEAALRESVAEAHEARCAAYEAEVRRMMGRRVDPTWSLSELFLVIDCLAASRAAAGAPDDALREYAELEACRVVVEGEVGEAGAAGAASRRHPGGRPRTPGRAPAPAPALLPRLFASEAGPMFASRADARTLVASTPDLPDRELRQLLFASSARVLAREGRLAELASRGRAFVAAHRGQLAAEGAPEADRSAWAASALLALGDLLAAAARRRAERGSLGAGLGRASLPAAATAGADGDLPAAGAAATAAGRARHRRRPGSFGSSVGAPSQPPSDALAAVLAPPPVGARGPRPSDLRAWSLGVPPPAVLDLAAELDVTARTPGLVRPSARPLPSAPPPTGAAALLATEEAEEKLLLRALGEVHAAARAELDRVVASRRAAAAGEGGRTGPPAEVDVTPPPEGPPLSRGRGVGELGAGPRGYTGPEAADTRAQPSASPSPTRSATPRAPRSEEGEPATDGLTAVDLGGETPRHGAGRPPPASSLPSRVSSSSSMSTEVAGARPGDPTAGGPRLTASAPGSLEPPGRGGGAPGAHPDRGQPQQAPPAPSSSARPAPSPLPPAHRRSASVLPASGPSGAEGGAGMPDARVAERALLTPRAASPEPREEGEGYDGSGGAAAEGHPSAAPGGWNPPLPRPSPSAAPPPADWRLRAATSDPALHLSLWRGLSEAAAACHARCGRGRCAAALAGDLARAGGSDGLAAPTARVLAAQAASAVAEGWDGLADRALSQLTARAELEDTDDDEEWGGSGDGERPGREADPSAAGDEPARGPAPRAAVAAQAWSALLALRLGPAGGGGGAPELVEEARVGAAAALARAGRALAALPGGGAPPPRLRLDGVLRVRPARGRFSRAFFAGAPTDAEAPRAFPAGGTDPRPPAGFAPGQPPRLLPAPGGDPDGHAPSAAVGDALLVWVEVENTSSSPLLLAGASLVLARAGLTSPAPLECPLSLDPGARGDAPRTTVLPPRGVAELSFVASPQEPGEYSPVLLTGTVATLEPGADAGRPDASLLGVPFAAGVGGAVEAYAQLGGWRGGREAGAPAPEALGLAGVAALRMLTGLAAGEGAGGAGSAARTAAPELDAARRPPHPAPATPKPPGNVAVVASVGPSRPRVSASVVAPAGALRAGEPGWLGLRMESDRDDLGSAALALRWPSGGDEGGLEPLAPGLLARVGGFADDGAEGLIPIPWEPAGGRPGAPPRFGTGADADGAAAETWVLLPPSAPGPRGSTDGGDGERAPGARGAVAWLWVRPPPLPQPHLSVRVGLPGRDSGPGDGPRSPPAAAAAAAAVAARGSRPTGGGRRRGAPRPGAPQPDASPALELQLSYGRPPGAVRAASHSLKVPVRRPLRARVRARALRDGGVAVAVRVSLREPAAEGGALIRSVALRPQGGMRLRDEGEPALAAPQLLKPGASLAATFILDPDDEGASAGGTAGDGGAPTRARSPDRSPAPYRPPPASPSPGKRAAAGGAARAAAAARRAAAGRSRPSALVVEYDPLGDAVAASPGDGGGGASRATYPLPSPPPRDALAALGSAVPSPSLATPAPPGGTPPASPRVSAPPCVFSRLITFELEREAEDPTAPPPLRVRFLGPQHARFGAAASLTWRLELGTDEPETLVRYELAAGPGWDAAAARSGQLLLGGELGPVATLEASWAPTESGLLAAPTLRLCDLPSVGAAGEGAGLVLVEP